MVARRYKTDERRQEIINVTLQLISENGVRGTTLNRIAARIGITTPALYGHFPNRKELLLEAMDTLFEKVRDLHRSTTQTNALERLREIGLAHTNLVSSEGGFALALFEFIAAPPDEELREALGLKELTLVEDLAGIVREGQGQGTVRKDADPYQIAWMLVSRSWTEDVAHLMGISDHWNAVRSKWMLEHILGLIAIPEAAPVEVPV